MELGDNIAEALAAVGITDKRVEEWLGRPCKCKERQEKLNQLGRWASRVIRGRVENAKKYLISILGGDN